jgi:hypothetical protein
MFLQITQGIGEDQTEHEMLHVGHAMSKKKQIGYVSFLQNFEFPYCMLVSQKAISKQLYITSHETGSGQFYDITNCTYCSNYNVLFSSGILNPNIFRRH